MENSKPTWTPLATSICTTDKDSSSSKAKKEQMKGIPYASVVGSLMYAMVEIWADLAYVVGVMSCYMLNPRKRHLEEVKHILWCHPVQYPICMWVTVGTAKVMDEEREMSATTICYVSIVTSTVTPLCYVKKSLILCNQIRSEVGISHVGIILIWLYMESKKMQHTLHHLLTLKYSGEVLKIACHVSHLH